MRRTTHVRMAAALAYQAPAACPAGTLAGTPTVAGARRWAGRLGLRPPALDIGLRSRALDTLSARELRGRAG